MTIETTLLEQAYVVEESEIPVAPVGALASPVAAGNVDDGAHSYKVTYTSSAGESAPSLVSNTVTVADKTTNGKVDLTLPAIGTQPGSAGYGATGWKVYRTVAAAAVAGPWKLVATVLAVAGVAYLDNIADGSLGANAPTVSTASDGVFGFGVLTQPLSTDAFRHLELTLDKKHNSEPSPEKRGTPDRAQSLPRASDTTFDLASCFWEPSGTLGTPSYISKFLKNGFGKRTTPTLATTVASGGSTTGAVLTSATGLVVGDTIVVTLPSGAREITRIKTLVTATVTFDALSAAPANGAAVVSGVNYALTNRHPSSLGVFKYHTAGGFQEAVKGGLVNTMGLMFDGGKEVGLKFGGPGKDWVRTGFTQPAAFTTVGSPASGLVGNFYVDGNSFLVLTCEINADNKSLLRKGEIGTQGLGTGIINHEDFREITVSVSFYLEDTNLLGKAETKTRAVLRLLIGDTNGSMVGVVCPNVEFEIPPIPGTGGPKVVTIEGVAYSAGVGNDQIFAGEH